MNSKPSYKNIEFDVLVRHNDLRKAIAANPSWARLEKTYLAIARKRAGTFFQTQTKLCKQMGYDYEDVVQYTTCWAVNFIGRFEMTAKPDIENKRLFSAYLSQRLQEFSEILQKKNRSVGADQGMLEEFESGKGKLEPSLFDMLSTLDPKVRNRKLRAVLRSKKYSKEIKALAAKALVTSFETPA